MLNGLNKLCSYYKMDQNLPILDIADIDFVENVAHINNPNITINKRNKFAAVLWLSIE